MTAAGTLERPRGQDAAVLLVAVIAVSTSSALIAGSHAPKLGAALWRNVFACGLLVPISLLGSVNRRQVASLARPGPQRLALPGGVLLAAHFSTWMSSLSLTSVASAVALVCTQPMWAALIASVRGERLPGRAWLGMGVSLVGVLFVTGIDVTVSARAVAGDLLALVAAVFVALYTNAGSSARQVLSTVSYTAVCYGACAVTMLVICLVGGVSMWGYAGRDWWLLVGLTVGPQLLGHSMLNRALARVSPTVVGLAVLLEVPGGVLIAWAWPGQRPHLLTLPGIVLLLVGIGIVIGTDRPAAVAAADPEL